MNKKIPKKIEKERERQQKRYEWIVKKSKTFDKNIIYKYFEANHSDKQYIKELKELGKYEEAAVRWWVGNVFMNMEVGSYDEQTFNEQRFIEDKELVELPRIRELRLRTIGWVERNLQKVNPQLKQQLLNYGADFNRAEYIGNSGNKTRIVIPSYLGNLVVIYDPSSQTFEVTGS